MGKCDTRETRPALHYFAPESKKLRSSTTLRCGTRVETGMMRGADGQAGECSTAQLRRVDRLMQVRKEVSDVLLEVADVLRNLAA